MKMCKRRNVTLIEMMIVMFLIALIIGVVAYNYQGTLDEGKAFKTKAGMEKLETILTLIVSEDPSKEGNLHDNWRTLIRNSPLVQNPKSLIKDGWGQDYDVKYEDGHVKVTSQRYQEYLRKNPGTMFRNESREE